ncbi:hypothetical protein NL462_27425, partial [Klebsiella pneumoniae]|nr:hypothetical protein [Klebsiella pneumoniae]
VASLNPLTEAIAPGLAQRDAGWRLVQVNYRPINLAREELRQINLSLNCSGQIGKAIKTPQGTDAPRPGYYFGFGPTLKLANS